MMSDKQCVDSLRLSEQERRAILQELERANCGPHIGDLRVADRVPYNVPEGLILILDNQPTHYLVRPRNLSATGLGALHGCFVYPGTSCTVELRARDGRAIPTRAKVVRCRCVRGRVHEIGLRFKAKIDVHQFVPTAADEATTGPPAGCPADAAPADLIALTSQLHEQALNGTPRAELCRTLRSILVALGGKSAEP